MTENPRYLQIIVNAEELEKLNELARQDKRSTRNYLYKLVTDHLANEYDKTETMTDGKNWGRRKADSISD